MSARSKGGIYQRGDFWLDFDRGKDGRPSSSKLYIWWYDAARGRQRRKTTGTADVRLACDKLDEHYLATFQPTDRDRTTYDVSTALVDYYLEHGSQRSSAEAIKARLKHVHTFMEREISAGRMIDPVPPSAIDDGFVDRFRSWMADQPIVAKKKNADGAWIDGASRPRTAATIEESVVQLKAALNHAKRKRRISVAPEIQTRTRAQVTAPRVERITVAQMGEMLDYSLRGAGKLNGHANRLMPLRRYLIAAIATLARPDAIMDMSVAPERGQWIRDDRRFALNPRGRLQTRKHRPLVPVGPNLEAWLAATQNWFVVHEREIEDEEEEDGIRIEQLRVASIRSAWDTMRATLKLPAGWGPKLLRHSMATELRKRRVDPWELSGQLGHRVLSTSETYAAFAPDYLGSVQAGITEIFSELEKAAGQAVHPSFTRAEANVAALPLSKMAENRGKRGGRSRV